MTDTIVTAVQSILIALIGGFFMLESRKRKKENERVEKRASVRAKEAALNMEMTAAGMRLNIATARAVMDGKANGDMGKSLEEAEKYRRKYYSFVNETMADHLENE